MISCVVKIADGIWKLYDRVNHTFEYPDDDYFYVHVIRLLPFEDIPTPFQRYIIYKASGKAAVQLVANPQLQQMLSSFEMQARAACLEYECNQGDHNFMGWPDESAYQSYKPYQMQDANGKCYSKMPNYVLGISTQPDEENYQDKLLI